MRATDFEKRASDAVRSGQMKGAPKLDKGG
jgi:hypothetical protein